MDAREMADELRENGSGSGATRDWLETEQIRGLLRATAEARSAARQQVIDLDARVRELVVAGRDAGLSVQECADAIGVSRSAVYKARHIRGPKDQEAKG